MQKVETLMDMGFSAARAQEVHCARMGVRLRAMQCGQVMGDNLANFMLNSNHKDAIAKTRK